MTLAKLMREDNAAPPLFWWVGMLRAARRIDDNGYN